MDLVDKKMNVQVIQIITQKERYIKEKKKLTIDDSIQSSKRYLFPDFDSLCNKNNVVLFNMNECNKNIRIY